ncbi:MAG: GHKL domain-containing protein, partial [Myxococcales bacterium]
RTTELGQSYEALQKTQGELVRREQLAVVGELAAVIAHEVRNPLAVINNAVAGLKRDGTDPGDRATLLAIITEESARLNRLVGDLLSYARPVSPQRQAVHLGEFVERSVALLLPPGTGVTVHLSCDPALPLILLDPGLMRQVLDNIVGNALQAMHDRGELSIRIDATSEPRGVRIEIEDTGDGMDTLVRAQARTPFFTTRPSGTGLGLAIVDRIVEAHGGTMTLVSTPGHGTTVRLSLPEGRESQPPSPSIITRAGL